MQRVDDAWIDVSVSIHSEMPVWPGSPPVWIREVEEFTEDEPARVSVLSMSSHTGTHWDAPAHFIDDGATIDEMPASLAIGEATVVHVEGAAVVEPDHLADVDLDSVDRLLFRTENSPVLWEQPEFVETYTHLSTAAAELIAEHGVDLVGVDYLSAAGYQRNEVEVHETLLGNDVWLLEGLNLDGVPEGPVDLVAPPLKVEGCDGAPTRAMVRPR